MMFEKTRISFDTSKHPIRDLYSSIACVITRKTANMAKQIENNGSFLLYLQTYSDFMEADVFENV